MSIQTLARRIAAPLFAALLLAGCGSAEAATLIATYPKQEPTAIASYPEMEPPVSLHYSVTIAVYDVDWAAAQAKNIARDYGGYLRRYQDWYDRDGKHVFGEVAVPAGAADSAFDRLLQLGRRLDGNEVLAESCVFPARYEGSCMAVIAVEFQPEPASIRCGGPSLADILTGVFFAGLLLFCIALIIAILILFFAAVKKAAGWINRL